MREFFTRLWRAAGKRAFDVVLAGTALIVLFPVILAVAIGVALAMGRPVLFRQVRPGLRSRPFTLLKFRTMTDAKGSDGELLPDAERMTATGNVLRAASLDELPQLWNVLTGSMSLVGPRPLVTRYLTRYSPAQARRHEVRPGITGWAQVHGRNASSWEEKFERDVWYVDNCSFTLDLKIIGMTIAHVLRRDGINHPEHATSPEFLGSEQASRGRAHGFGD